MKPLTRLGRRGVNLIEVMALVAVLGVLAGCMQALMRRNAMGQDLIAYTQAASFAERLLELRRANGRGADIRGLPEVVRQRYPFPFRLKEEPFGGTGLAKVTVTVAWHASWSRPKEVRLVGLMP
ncbi:MAG: hypothetical protein HY927_12645 [Elusimicrobia bacterium]|nr:hypothetical protein [Elusimicrobiota bacterium]